MVPARELFLIIGFFVVMQLDAVVHSTSNVAYYDCQYIPQLFNLTMNNTDHCLESQLTDDSRLKLLNVFNDYRRNLSMSLKNGKRYNNIFYMVNSVHRHYPSTPIDPQRYHYVCELMAAEVMNNQIMNVSQSPKTKVELIHNVMAVITRNLPSPVDPSFGSLSDRRDKDRTYFGFTDNITVFDFTLNESTQSEFIRAFIMNISAMTDPYLTIEEERVMWPGTTHFGCSIRFNDTLRVQQDGKAVNHLTCVFLTLLGAMRRLQEGDVNNYTCADANPRGYFIPDADTGLCMHAPSLDDLNVGDVPCQFFYNISRKQLPVLVDTCNGEDPKTDQRFLVPPDRYKCAKISYSSSVTDFTFGIDINNTLCIRPNKPPPGDEDYEEYDDGDGALKLHSASVYVMIVLAAFVQKFCS